MPIKYDEDYVRNYLSEINCELLSNYKNVKTKFKYKCHCGEISEGTFDSFINSKQKGCVKCRGKRSTDKLKLNYEFVYEYFIEQGCKLLEESYINSSTKMRYICTCGREAYTTWNKFRIGRRCKRCATEKNIAKQRRTIEEVLDYFTNQKCTLLTHNYINGNQTLEYICYCGSTTSKTFNSFLNNSKCNCLKKIKKVYTKESLISHFWIFSEENGRYLKLSDLSSESSPSKNDYLNTFSTWSNFESIVGIKGKFGLYKVDEDYLINNFKIKEKNEIINNLIEKRSWQSIYQKAKLLGLVNEKRSYSNGELLQFITDFQTTHEVIPTVKDFAENDNYPSPSLYSNRFGSWSNALRQAGIEVKTRKRLSVADKEGIIQKYKDSWSISEIALTYQIDPSTVYSTLRDNNIDVYKKSWTMEEVNVLKQVYPEGSWDEILKALPKRDKETILQKASSLKIKKMFHKYSEKEIETLKDNYSMLSLSELKKLLPNRTDSSIVSKANKLGLIQREKWTDDEVGLLTKHYPHSSEMELVKLFPNRTYSSLITTASSLKIKKSEEYYERIKTRNKEKLIKQLIEFSDLLGRTPTTIDINNNPQMPGSMTYNRYFNSYTEACIEAGLPVNTTIFGESFHCVSKNGDICLSKKEKEITDFFIDNNVSYKKEMLYKDIIKDYDEKNIRCDWFINDSIIVEYFGMPEKEYYRNRMQGKIDLCKKHNKTLIALYEKDVTKQFKGLIVKFDSVDIKLKVNHNTSQSPSLKVSECI